MAGSSLRTSARFPLFSLRRVARSTVLRAAVRGRIPWIVALQVLALLEGGAA